MSTSKYHKKRKKGARSHFYRQKSHLSKNKENHPPELIYENVALPPHWQLVSSQFCKIEEVNGLCMVTASIAIDLAEKSWIASIHGTKIPRTCKILSQYPTQISSALTLSEIIATIDNAVLCPGNPDDKFVEIYDRKGGVVKGERGNGPAVAIIEKAHVEDLSGNQCCQTIRRLDCDIIID